MFPFSDFLSLAIAPASLCGGKGQATGSPHEEKSCISMDVRPGLQIPRASESLAAMIIPIETAAPWGISCPVPASGQ